MKTILSHAHGRLFATCLAFALLVIGCSPQSSEPDGEAVVKHMIARDSQGRIKLVSFRKTDGQKGEVLGVTVYKLNWRAEIEFMENCAWGGDFSTIAQVATGPAAFLPQNAGKAAVAKGDRKTIEGSFSFEKTEKGWNLLEGL